MILFLKQCSQKTNITHKSVTRSFEICVARLFTKMLTLLRQISHNCCTTTTVNEGESVICYLPQLLSVSGRRQCPQIYNESRIFQFQDSVKMTTQVYFVTYNLGCLIGNCLRFLAYIWHHLCIYTYFISGPLNGKIPTSLDSVCTVPFTPGSEPSM